MKTPFRRKPIAASLGLAALLLIVGGLWLYRRPLSAPVAAAAPKGGAQNPPIPNRASAAVEGPDSAGKPRTEKAVEVEFCGKGQVALDQNDDFAVARFLAALTKGTGERWLTAMLNSDDYRARAAGLLLQGKIANGELVGQPMAEQTRDELVQLAVGAGDPAVYAMAVYACGILWTPLAGACSRISLSNWARLDPGNAVPWLALAAAARANHDAEAEGGALARAAAGNSFDSYNWSLLAFAEPETPKDATPLESAYFSTAIMGISSAFAPPYNISTKLCSVESLRQSGVRDECDKLAELMVRKGTTLLDFSIGKNLGARLGWTKQRVEALEQERDALLQTMIQAVPQAATDQWTCSGVERTNAHMRRFTALGELGAARELLERSGETVPDMARRQKAYEDQLLKGAAETSYPKSGSPDGSDTR